MAVGLYAELKLLRRFLLSTLLCALLVAFQVHSIITWQKLLTAICSYAHMRCAVSCMWHLNGLFLFVVLYHRSATGYTAPSDTPLFRHMRKMIGSMEFRTAYSFVPLGSSQDYMIAILCAGHPGGPPGWQFPMPSTRTAGKSGGCHSARRHFKSTATLSRLMYARSDYKVEITSSAAKIANLDNYQLPIIWAIIDGPNSGMPSSHRIR